MNTPKLTKAVGYTGTYVPKVTDVQIMLDALLSGQSITVREANERLDIIYPSQIINHLRNHGINVQKAWIKGIRSDGRSYRCANYFIAPKDIAAIKEDK